MNKQKAYLKNRKKSNRRFLLILLVFLAICFFASRVLVNNMNGELDKYSGQISEKKEDIETVKKDIDDIKNNYKQRNTDKFKEKIARDRLGMVKSDEYVYKDKNNQ